MALPATYLRMYASVTTLPAALLEALLSRLEEIEAGEKATALSMMLGQWVKAENSFPFCC